MFIFEWILKHLSVILMASSYPGSLDSFTTKVDKVDDVDDDHMNEVQNSIVAIQTELGTDVAGSKTNLKDRLAVSIADDGAMRQGTSVRTRTPRYDRLSSP